MTQANGVVEALTPIARRLLTNPNGTSADILYTEASYVGVAGLSSISSSRLSSVLTRALRDAGGVASDQSRPSTISSAKGRRIIVWFRGA